MVPRYLISFLGDGGYKDAQYSLSNNTAKVVTTPYVQVAAMEFYSIQHAYVVCPTDVAYKAFEKMQQIVLNCN